MEDRKSNIRLMEYIKITEKTKAPRSDGSACQMAVISKKKINSWVNEDEIQDIQEDRVEFHSFYPRQSCSQHRVLFASVHFPGMTT
jgi:hypothetical protein